MDDITGLRQTRFWMEQHANDVEEDDDDDEGYEAASSDSTYAPPPADFTMAWFTPIEVEQRAAVAALDDEYAVDKEDYLERHRLQGDLNLYELGHIKNHNVVVCRPPDERAGPIVAAMAWRDLQRSFPNIKHLLIVGIAGGAPNKHNEPDIRLGDVVLGLPTKTHPGMIQIDAGWQNKAFESTININEPPRTLQALARRVMSWPQEKYSRKANLVPKTAEALLRRLEWEYPGEENDCCFLSDYTCVDVDSCPTACRDPARQQARPQRKPREQRLHAGLICSSSKVIKDGDYRDEIVDERMPREQILCFEMEGYGIASEKQCLSIRGISDYADSHKTKRWHKYASAYAAAVARIITSLLVDRIPENDTEQTKTGEPSQQAVGSRSKSMHIRKRTMSSNETTSPKMESLSRQTTLPNHFNNESHSHQYSRSTIDSMVAEHVRNKTLPPAGSSKTQYKKSTILAHPYTDEPIAISAAHTPEQPDIAAFNQRSMQVPDFPMPRGHTTSMSLDLDRGKGKAKLGLGIDQASTVSPMSSVSNRAPRHPFIPNYNRLVPTDTFEDEATSDTVSAQGSRHSAEDSNPSSSPRTGQTSVASQYNKMEMKHHAGHFKSLSTDQMTFSNPSGQATLANSLAGSSGDGEPWPIKPFPAPYCATNAPATSKTVSTPDKPCRFRLSIGSYTPQEPTKLRFQDFGLVIGRCSIRLCSDLRMSEHSKSMPSKLVTLRYGDLSQSVHFWVPVDGVKTIRNSTDLAFEWSDCRSVSEKIENNQVSTFQEYNAHSPNMKLTLKFLQEQDANVFYDIMFNPQLRHSSWEMLSNPKWDAKVVQLVDVDGRDINLFLRSEGMPRDSGIVVTAIFQNGRDRTLKVYFIRKFFYASIDRARDSRQTSVPSIGQRFEFTLTKLHTIQYRNDIRRADNDGADDTVFHGTPREQQFIEHDTNDTAKGEPSITLDELQFSLFVGMILPWQLKLHEHVNVVRYRNLVESKVLEHVLVLVYKHQNGLFYIYCTKTDFSKETKTRRTWYLFEVNNDSKKEISKKDISISLPIKRYQITNIISFDFDHQFNAKSLKLKIEFPDAARQSKMWKLMNPHSG